MGVLQRHAAVRDSRARIYVCAACELRNESTTLGFTRLPLEALAPLRYAEANAADAERRRRIDAARRSADPVSGVTYNNCFNYWVDPVTDDYYKKKNV